MFEALSGVYTPQETFPGEKKIAYNLFARQTFDPSPLYPICYIGPFILTDVLLPLLKRTAAEPGSDVRIVNVVVPLHANVTPTTFATQEALNKDYSLPVLRQLETYGSTKLMNILHVKALQTCLDAENANITCLAVHPGGIATKGSAGFMGSVPCVNGLLKHVVMPLFFSSWSAGGRVVVFAAAGKVMAGPRHNEYNGPYLAPGIAMPSESARDTRLQTELYETTDRAVQELGL
ncbi:hypothetical protein B0H16DRAFT_1793358 [Mycena metata]|uniref:NAD(P)-binding protein n=1 Tax=Mycena metata TaxID=1033252 RepID=A0AAD7JM96_9AGAR|nr:hypothetical protein B0H16DRAFT_1793358 [Mycena metata]